MYTAKSYTWRIIWIFLICISIGFTSFHVQAAVSTYLASPTVTVFERATSDDVLYPSLRLCYNFWCRFVNWKKALSLNHSKETLLYGFSFLNTIFTESDFDADEAATNFSRLLKETNFSTVSNFYKNLVKPLTLGTWSVVHNDAFAKLFHDIKILYKRNVYFFCFFISSEQLSDFFRNQEMNGVKSKWLQFDTVDETYANFREIQTPREYSSYMKSWVNTRTVYEYNSSSNSLLTNFAPTAFLFPNVFSEQSVDIITDNYQYFVDMKSTSSKWKNTRKNVCLEGQQSIAYNETCGLNCQALASRKRSSCRMLNTAGMINEDVPEHTCHRAISSITSGRMIQNATAMTEFGVPQALNQTSTLDEAEVYYNECVKSCIGACQLWDYSLSVSSKQIFKAVSETSTKKTTSITIAYPETMSVILMVETDAQTWDSLLGNVGGLLGIWTGASLLSFVQMFYLCCCAEVEGWSNNFHVFDRFRAKLSTRMDNTFHLNHIERFQTTQVKTIKII